MDVLCMEGGKDDFHTRDSIESDCFRPEKVAEETQGSGLAKIILTLLPGILFNEIKMSAGEYNKMAKALTIKKKSECYRLCPLLVSIATMGFFPTSAKAVRSGKACMIWPPTKAGCFSPSHCRCGGPGQGTNWFHPARTAAPTVRGRQKRRTAGGGTADFQRHPAE